MSEGKIVPGSIYLYAPNRGAPVFFSVAFAVVGVSHLWQCHRYKSWRLTILHPFSCFMFAVGFALREYGAFNYYNTPLNLNIYIASTCMIYMAPPLLELANFHVLGRILSFVPYCAPLPPNRILSTFSVLSALVEVLNAIGISYLANTNLPPNITQLGENLEKASLALQLAVIAVFILVAAIFHHRCRRAGLTTNKSVTIPLWTLYTSTGLVLIRTVYRTVEHMGFDTLTNSVRDGDGGIHISPILRHEWFFYVFEASVMWANSTLWTVMHPRRFLPEDRLVYLARDGVTEVQVQEEEKQEEAEKKRAWWWVFVDPFGCMEMRQGWRGREA